MTFREKLIAALGPENATMVGELQNMARDHLTGPECAKMKANQRLTYCFLMLQLCFDILAQVMPPNMLANYLDALKNTLPKEPQ